MFRKCHYHCTESAVVKPFSQDYSVGATVGSSFAVSAGDVKRILVSSTTYLTSKKCILGLSIHETFQ